MLLRPVPADRRAARLSLIAAGLALYGFSDGMLVLAGVGLDPWDVLHQGLSRTLGLQVGTWSIIVGAIVLLGWLPLRQRPGVGTLANVVAVGTGVNLTLALVPTPNGLPAQLTTMIVAVVLNAVATAVYIGAGLGPGPRDGLMVGIAARGRSVRVVRTAIELSVLVGGWLLGGSVGVGTVVYAVGIGPLVHILLPRLGLHADRVPDGLGLDEGVEPGQALIGDPVGGERCVDPSD